MPSLSSTVSTAALVVAVLFMIGAVQSSGSILDTCHQGGMGMNEISFADCRAIGRAIKGTGPKEASYLALLLVIARVEATLFLGLGGGAVWALAFLEKGTKEVAVVHLMHALWAIAVCLVHCDEAGLLEPFSSPDPNASTEFYDKIPIHFVTGVMALLFSAAFFLSAGTEPAPKRKTA